MKLEYNENCIKMYAGENWFEYNFDAVFLGERLLSRFGLPMSFSFEDDNGRGSEGYEYCDFRDFDKLIDNLKTLLRDGIASFDYQGNPCKEYDRYPIWQYHVEYNDGKYDVTVEKMGDIGNVQLKGTADKTFLVDWKNSLESMKKKIEEELGRNGL